MTLFEKSIRTLELPAVLDMLSDCAVSQPAKDASAALSPVTDIHEARALLEETSAARTMMLSKGAPGFTGVRDIRAAVRRAEIGGMLNTSELLEIAALLRTASDCAAYARDRVGHTSVDALFYALRTNKFLENKISSAIIGVDEIADAASGELSDIRRRMRAAGERIRSALNKIITSPTYQKALQENIITVKNDRYVVPVRADHKSVIPGLVHEISSSGATLFIEPMGVVQINNEIRELMAKEKQEIERILIDLTADVSTFGEEIISDFQLLTALDLIFAKAKLSQRLNAHEPELIDSASDGGLILRRCRHPLLDPAQTVPTDLKLGGEFDTLVITGPNTGGKTVALKTLGLFCVMAQCGLHIPAESDSRMPVFKKILADIGDEQSIEQSLSTFSSHMTNIVKILAECEYPCLLLFDELGAGTDPVEGAALAISVIEYARRRGALIAATTHYSELKTYALAQEGVENASCEFDVETLRPTFRLLIGVPGRSNAFAISRRLGLPESVIEGARERVSGENISFEEAVGQLESARRSAENERDEAYRLRAAADRDARLAEKYRAELEREREKLAIEARRESRRILDETRAHADAIIAELREIRRAARDEGDIDAINALVPDVLRNLNELDSSAPIAISDAEDSENVIPGDIKVGDTVRILAFGTTAEVSAISGATLELTAGSMKITAKPEEVRRVAASSRKKKKASAASEGGSGSKNSDTSRPPAPRELDLRGMTADDALPILEHYLDSARLAHLETVTIIHGKGTGALRAAVQGALRGERGIKSFRAGRYGEGDLGVTVVELK
ncbi:MAG: endonuclease MutS2 [Oscillospiraceae bacterium]|jgi:DNA mismatch repair protein MutS2|nr:endonuclease MutS2 [Oscillospiraceae bacterium]